MEAFEDVDVGLDEPQGGGSRLPVNLSPDLLRSPWLIGGAGVVLGLILGLVWAYLIAPVQWVDQPIDNLRADLKEEYARLVIDSYSRNEDLGLAVQRISEIGDDASQTLANISNSPGSQDIEAINQVLTNYNIQMAGGLPEAEEGTPPQAEEPAAEEGGLSPVGTFMIACGALSIITVILAFYIFWRRQNQGPIEPSTAAMAQEFSRSVEQTDYVALGADQPLAQWMTTYLVGDDLFDDSFSIDSAIGEFMGECGVGIAETIGVGEPKRVSAFEVWLFDKNDIQTVTKVVMSAHAHNDDATRDRLAAKGEPIFAEPGKETVLETATLQMVARIVDMSYGDGALPEQSFFERMTIELAVWSKV
ncbi:MAG: hypothetical protein DWQ07_24890 [Chloroflexi bacterium]|nr:MAG: hypothetical protein DWQ07_24890 [Chloroflexota bacterium]MBL1197070.1 hypothetical protein [Chloroflexota bacterium]NOH14365.1 hypothetical protein [Chloroflexota bacterium]